MSNVHSLKYSYEEVGELKKNHQSMEKKEDALQLKVDVLHSQNEKKKK